MESGLFPLCLGRCMPFLCSFVVTVIVIVRTILEDNTLQQELEGYSDYANKVRFKLIHSFGEHLLNGGLWNTV